MKLQKSFLSLLFLVACIYTSTVFAAPEKRLSNLGDVTLRFCNDSTVVGGTKTLVMDAETEKDEDICIYLNNNGPTATRVSINFVDGTITADADQKKACEPEDQTALFGQYVTAENTGFLIEPGQTLQTKAKVRFPTGYAGTSYGCVTYKMLNDTNATGAQANVGMFSIEARRAYFVDVNVKGDIIAKTAVAPETNTSLQVVNGVTPNIAVYKNLIENIYKGRITIVNTGNVAVTANMQATMKILRGLGKKEYMLGTGMQTILPKQSKSFEFPLPKRVLIAGGITIDIYEQSVFKPQQGKEVIVTEMHHTANWMPWYIYLFLLVPALIATVITKINKRKK